MRGSNLSPAASHTLSNVGAASVTTNGDITVFDIKFKTRVNASNALACARPQVTVFACAASLLLQQGRDVDVPADRLSVEAAGEQVARLVLLVPHRAAHHASVALHAHKHTHTNK